MDDGLMEEIVKFINLNHIDYPSIKSFVDRAVREKLKKLVKNKKS